MYPQARVYIRTALLHLLAAFTVGGLLLFNRAFALEARIAALLPVFYHLLMVGWTTQLICGVALWMFPPRSRAEPRGDERLGWATYAALNLGLVVRAVAEPLHTWSASAASGWALAVSGLLQALAMWLFVATIWPRVKGRHGDKAKQ